MDIVTIASDARNAPVARTCAARNAFGAPWGPIFCCARRVGAQRVCCARVMIDDGKLVQIDLSTFLRSADEE